MAQEIDTEKVHRHAWTLAYLGIQKIPFTLCDCGAAIRLPESG